MKHEHKVLKAKAAGLAKLTFSRKAGAHDKPSRKELLEELLAEEIAEAISEAEAEGMKPCEKPS